MLFSQQELLLFLTLKLVLDYSCLCFPIINLQTVGHDPLPKEVMFFILHLKQQQKPPPKYHSDFTETLIINDYIVKP